MRLETAHDQATDLFFEVNEAVGVAHDRQVRMHALDPAGDNVHVLGRVQRHRDAAHEPDLARPLAGAVDDDLGGNVATVRLDAAGDAVLHRDAGDLDPLENPGAAVARALGQRLRQIGRIGLAIARQPDGADQIVRGHHRPKRGRLLGRDDVDLHPLSTRRGGCALQHRHAVGRACHRQRTAVLPAGGETRLGLQFAVELRGVFDQAGHVGMAAQLPDKPGGMPGGAAAELALLEQNDIGPTQLCQMVGHRAADDTAADDDDACLRWEFVCHERSAILKNGRHASTAMQNINSKSHKTSHHVATISSGPFCDSASARARPGLASTITPAACSKFRILSGVSLPNLLLSSTK